MKPKINYHYTLPFKEVNAFNWNTKPIDISMYKERIIPKLPRIIKALHTPGNRQAVIVVNEEEKENSCLLTIQYQIVDNLLYVIGNYRSQCTKNGRPNDSLMLQYLASIVMKAMNLDYYKIDVNVGNFHYNPSIG